jgi:ferredoxin
MPRTYTIDLELPAGARRQLEVSSGEFILTAAYRAGLDLPSMCLQGWCLTCAARAESGGQWDQSQSRRYFPQDRAAGFLLPCTAQPRSDLTLKTHQRTAMRDHRIARGLPAPRG